MTLRRGARRPLGHLGVGLQRARPGSHLPVLELRGAGPRAQARPRRRPGRRALRHGSRRDGRPGGRRAQPRGARGGGRPAGRTASTRRSTTRRSRLPEGKRVAIVRAYMAHHQGMSLVALANVLHDGRDARAVPRRADRPGDGAAPAGARAARRRGGAAPGRGGRARRPTSRDFVAPVFRQFTSPHEPTPRTHLLSNGRYSVMVTAAGSGYSRCARPRGHPLARGRHARPLGELRLPARRPQRRGLVGRLPAHRRRAGRYRGDLLRGPRGVPPPRRRDHDHARGARLARGRRRDAPRLDHEPRAASRARSS